MITPRRIRGFTLLELLIALAIIAVLLSLSLVSLRSIRAAVDNTRCLNNLRQLLQGLNIVKNTEGGLLPFASYAPTESDGPAKSWQSLHAKWCEAMGVPSPRLREGVRTNTNWKVYDTQAPWRCPLDKPGVVKSSDFPGNSGFPDPDYSYAAVTLTSYEYWPAGHMAAFVVRGWDETSARRIVGLAYEEEPNAAVLDEAYRYHDIGRPTRYGNAVFIDGGAGRERMSEQQRSEFGAGIVKKYPTPK